MHVESISNFNKHINQVFISSITTQNASSVQSFQDVQASTSSLTSSSDEDFGNLGSILEDQDNDKQDIQKQWDDPMKERLKVFNLSCDSGVVQLLHSCLS